MSNVGPEARSFALIGDDDLARLATIAAHDLKHFFARYPMWASQYADRLLAFALCQGAATHYMGTGDGVHDFDVYAFFARHPSRPWYAKRNATADFGDAKFGTSVDSPQFVGRRVDLMGRSLNVELGTDPSVAIRDWLRTARPGQSAAFLAEKAVILLTPPYRRGEIVWPELSVTHRG